MACRGVHFAITDEQAQRLLTAPDDEAVMDMYYEIEEDEAVWEAGWAQETDKSWDALHRCLTDGTLDTERGTYPLHKVILGGQQLYSGDGWIIAYVSPDEVRDVAAALADVDRSWLEQRYRTLDFPNYQGVKDDEEWEYTWDWFEGVKDFYQRTAHAHRAVIFTVDQ